MLETKAFYDTLSVEYDSMTSFEQRLLKGRSLFQSLVEKYKINTALDAGAGTGVHSILLAQSGVAVTAVDVSQKMLRLLSLHASEQNLKIKTIKANFLDLPTKVHQKFDAIFCMGNTLVHAKTKRELSNILSNVHKLLKPNGTLFIQILNYDRIISRKEIIQNIKEFDGKIFIRFYGFADGYIDFNVLTIEHRGGVLQHKLQTTQLRPIMQKEIVGLLREVGFIKVEYLGNLIGDKYIKSKSKDLFIIARK